MKTFYYYGRNSCQKLKYNKHLNHKQLYGEDFRFVMWGMRQIGIVKVAAIMKRRVHKSIRKWEF